LSLPQNRIILGALKEEMAMKFTKSGLAAFFVTLAVLCASSAGAQAQTFNFQVCNKGSVSASVAISHMISVTDTRFEVEGWWTVTPGNCASLGTYPQGWFYFYAEQTNTQQVNWPGNFALCVQYPGPFTVVHTAAITCSNDQLKQFTAEQIPSTTGTFTWNLN
jgi:uncharacterized membrane protein